MRWVTPLRGLMTALEQSLWADQQTRKRSGRHASPCSQQQVFESQNSDEHRSWKSLLMAVNVFNNMINRWSSLRQPHIVWPICFRGFEIAHFCTAIWFNCTDVTAWSKRKATEINVIHIDNADPLIFKEYFLDFALHSWRDCQTQESWWRYKADAADVSSDRALFD